MKALILVGGYGTRLRPLTLLVPKPLIHFCNAPILVHQISALAKAGVKHVILAVSYQPSTMMEALTGLEDRFDIKISCSIEEEPLGTAGPIKLAEKLLFPMDEQSEAEDGSFFVLNSDIICDFPLEEMKQFHYSHNGEGTVMMTEVVDPSKYGTVVFHQSTGHIQKFMEKSSSFVGSLVNAGIYILRRPVVERIQARPTSIEREIFPKLASEEKLYGFQLRGYWADIGQPQDFLVGTRLHLASLAAKQLTTPRESLEVTGDTTQPQLAGGANVRGNVLIHESAKVGSDCVIGPDVVVGRGCVIGDGVRITGSTIMDNVHIESHAFIAGSIIGCQCRIGRWVRIEGLAVVAECCSVAEECFVNRAFVLPHKSVTESIHTAGQIIM